uniref:Uncharacterized protein n=1 Tax=viral metagenome TaxID=1070528 RepID=A0A6M3LG26_9ZZZZ
MEMNYKEYYNKQKEIGLEYQDFVGEILCQNGIVIMNYVSKKYQFSSGENKMGVEIKHDKMFRDTGNLYIELEEKSNPDNKNYIKSGIKRNDNTWLYVIGDYKTIYIFPKNLLLKLSEEYEPIENNTKTSIGFLLPIKEAEKHNAKVIKIP